jgi:hypothetical protein
MAKNGVKSRTDKIELIWKQIKAPVFAYVPLNYIPGMIISDGLEWKLVNPPLGTIPATVPFLPGNYPGQDIPAGQCRIPGEVHFVNAGKPPCLSAGNNYAPPRFRTYGEKKRQFCCAVSRSGSLRAWLRGRTKPFSF